MNTLDTFGLYISFDESHTNHYTLSNTSMALSLLWRSSAVVAQRCNAPTCSTSFAFQLLRCVSAYGGAGVGAGGGAAHCTMAFAATACVRPPLPCCTSRGPCNRSAHTHAGVYHGGEVSVDNRDAASVAHDGAQVEAVSDASVLIRLRDGRRGLMAPHDVLHVVKPGSRVTVFVLDKPPSHGNLLGTIHSSRACVCTYSLPWCLTRCCTAIAQHCP